MKKVVVLFLVVLMFSCSSDNSNGATITPQRLLGKWNFKSESTNGNAFVNYEHQCGTNKDFRAFFNTGKTVSSSFNTSCVLSNSVTSDWVLNGNILTISNENFDPMLYEYVYQIEYLTENELLVKQTIVASNGTTIYRISFTRD
jgi:hypothetical protein